MTLADLAAYQPVIRPVVEGRYRGYKIKSMGPPSSGALTVLQILGQLERFPIGDASQGYGFGEAQEGGRVQRVSRLGSTRLP